MKMDVNHSAGITMYEMLRLSRFPALIFAIVLALVPISVGQDKPTKKKDNETTTVISEGTGTNKQEALKDAFRNAVRQAVGVLIDAETLVKNDQVIEDKVIMFSDGIVKTYDELPTPTRDSDNALTRVKIMAIVEKQKLFSRLKSSNVQSGKLDGKGIFSEAVSRLDKDKEAVELITKHFEGFPEKYLKARIIGEPKLIEKGTDYVTMEFNVELEPDTKPLDQFIMDTIKLLDAIENANESVKCQIARNRSGFSLGKGSDLFQERLAELDSSLGVDKSGSGIILTTSKDLKGSNSKLTIAPLRASLVPVIESLSARPQHVEIKLLDEFGDIVASDALESFRCEFGVPEHGFLTYGILSKSGINRSAYCLAPFFISDIFGESIIYFKAFSSKKIRVPLADVSKATKYTVEVLSKY
jgi:hypothetical protein